MIGGILRDLLQNQADEAIEPGYNHNCTIENQHTNYFEQYLFVCKQAQLKGKPMWVITCLTNEDTFSTKAKRFNKKAYLHKVLFSYKKFDAF